MSTGFTHETADTARPYRDEWYTPKWLFEALGNPVFDLDPFAAPLERRHMTHVNAKVHFTETDNGLVRDWGTVFSWVNSPYGKAMLQCARKFTRHRGPGLMLCFNATDTEWCHELLGAGLPCLILNRRVPFIDGRVQIWDKKIKRMVPNPDFGTEDGSPGKGSLIFGRGWDLDLGHLQHAVRAGFGVIR